MQPAYDSERHFRLLSQLVLAHDSADTSSRLADAARNMSRDEFDALVRLSTKNHVIIRALDRWRGTVQAENKALADPLESALEEENTRIKRALEFLQRIWAAFEGAGCPVTVIKSLDHWPDLGSDLDHYTDCGRAH